jgi:sialidase-1
VVRHGERFINPGEAAAVELAGGGVMLNIRSESKEARRIVSTSSDGATGWSTPVFDEALYEPVCMASILRVGGGIAFANPDSRHIARAPGSWRGSRENLAVKLSRDDGRSWQASRVLEPGPAGYSDLASGADDSIYCFYERGGAGGNQMATASLTVAQFGLDWLAGAPRPL